MELRPLATLMCGFLAAVHPAVEQTARENSNVSSTPQYITLTDDGQLLAEATIRSATHRPSVHADLHCEAGHLPVGTRTRLVDAVLEATAAEPGIQLLVTLPAGDGEILDRLRQRCDNLQTRAAGASCLATGTLRHEEAGQLSRTS